jgi:hypothetical protein
MKKLTITATAALTIAGAAIVFTDGGPRRIREVLTGLKEAPTIVSTTGNGTLELEISRDEQEIEYALTFSDLEGDVAQAHIHIGPEQGSGGIVLWLCQGTSRDPVNPNTPECTQSNPLDTRSGTVTGVLRASDIRPQAGNGIGEGEFAELITLIRAGKTYANVHSTKFGPGEIRSQIARGGGRGDHSGH